jgi:hypothetical protein
MMRVFKFFESFFVPFFAAAKIRNPPGTDCAKGE